MLTIGIIGLVLTLIGRLLPSRKWLHLTFALGAFLLMLYAISLKDTIFTILNGVLFIVDVIQYVRYSR